MSFAAFVAVDWSGARPRHRDGRPNRYRGVAVAVCDAAAGMAAPVAPPAGGPWRRADVARWLAERLAAGERLLVGFDFAFGLPWRDGEGYLDGRAPAATTLPALWDLVEEASRGAEDFYGADAVDHPLLRPSFWVAGRQPPDWERRHTRRLTETVCRARHGHHPASVFKLAAASKQVGRGSLAGMRVLRWLRDALGGRLAVWPLDETGGRSVAVEIFPTLFRDVAGARGKIRSRSQLEPVLSRLAARPAATVPAELDDHTGDALVAAAGLRHWAARPAAWRPTEMTEAARLREGWIFGVGA